MLRRFGKIRLRWKYIITYVLVMLIPFSTLLGIFMADRIEVVQEDARSIYTSYLTQCVDSLNLKFSSLHSVAVSVLSDPRLQWTNLSSRQWEEIQAKDELKSHNTLNSMPGSMYLCFRKGDVLYSSAGKVSLEAMGKHVMYLSDETISELRQWLYTENHVRYWILDSRFADQRWLLIRYGNSLSENRDSAVLFTVPLVELMEWARTQLGSAGAYFAVTDENGRAMAVPKGMDKASVEAIAAASEVSLDSCSEVHWEDKVVYARGSSYNGYCCMLVIPEERMQVSIFSANPGFLTLAMIIMVIGLLGSTAIALVVYRPINLIYRQVAPEEETGAELETISVSLARLQQENRSLHESVESQISYVLDTTADRLLHGKIDAGRALAILKQNGVDFCYRLFMVAAVVYENSGEELGAIRTRIARGLTEFARQTAGIEMLLVEPAHRRQTIALINVEDRAIVDAMVERLCLSVHGDFRVGVSDVSEDSERFSRAFDEAMTCIGYLRERPARQSMDWREIAPGNIQSEAQLMRLERLEQSLMLSVRENNFSVCMEVLAALEGVALADSDPEVRVRLVHVLNEVLTHAFSIRNESLSKEILDVFGRSPSMLSDMIDGMRDLLNKLCEITERRAQAEQEQFYRDISNFVVEHFCETDFSLEAVAERFGMSVYVASRYFCNSTGENFKDMIARMRIEHAKMLLVETDSPLKDIVHSVGYQDVSSFIRKFKRSEGVTPGQYRGMNQDSGC